jgi:hypothetical protein
VKRRVKRLAYELELFKTWRIHSVMFVTQLESASEDSYKRFKFDHFDFVLVKKNIETNKSYEIKRILNKRTRHYEKIKMNQYLIRWKKYESEFNEWKNVSKLKHCIDLIKDFEHETRSQIKTNSQIKTRLQKKTRSRKNRVNNLHQQWFIKN